MNINPRVLNYIRTNKSNSFTIDGNVGIGTSTPTTTLDISGNEAITINSDAVYSSSGLNANSVLRIHNAFTDASGERYASIYLQNRSNNVAMGLISLTGQHFATQPGQLPGALTFGLRPNSGGGTITERMRIRSDGTIVLGNGSNNSAPNAAIIRTTDAIGNNINGANFTIQSGAGTGTGTGGNIILRTSSAGVSGTTLNPVVERMRIDASGNVGINTTQPICSLHINRTDAILPPRGTSAQRPQNPIGGMMRYNTDFDSIEWYNGNTGDWVSFTGVIATGGSITDITQNNISFRVHTFTTVGTSSFQVLRGGEVEYLVVAGGGAGSCGGGGAGGVLTDYVSLSAGNYPIVVGNGGTGLRAIFAGGPQPGTWRDERGTNGGNSSALSFTAVGGGAGGAYGDGGVLVRDGANGGSGGGGGGLFTNQTDTAGGNGTSGQGNNGGRSSGSINAGAGGGGGAGGAGSNGTGSGGAGGIGIQSNINGSNTFYGGGGSGGSGDTSSGTVAGGLGGGGFGLNNSVGSGGSPSGNGTPNTGGGGGGTGGDTVNANGNGGSGIVIIRYRI